MVEESCSGFFRKRKKDDDSDDLGGGGLDAKHNLKYGRTTIGPLQSQRMNTKKYGVHSFGAPFEC